MQSKKRRPGGPELGTIGEIIGGGYKFVFDSGYMNNILFGFEIEEYFEEVKESKVPSSIKEFSCSGNDMYYYNLAEKALK